VVGRFVGRGLLLWSQQTWFSEADDEEAIIGA
jgi:hypothetical protein